MTGKKLVVLATGGTIAGRAATATDTVGYTAAQLGVEALVASVPSLAGWDLVTEQVAQVDSKDMTFDIWRTLAMRCRHWLGQPGVAGIVVTHGTDTLEETAYFLHAVLAPAKPVVLTCAMRPATALSADGPQNIADAATVAMSAGARGVVAVGAGTIRGAVDVVKEHTYRLDAFGCGDAGPIGYIEAGHLRLLRDWPATGNAQHVLDAVAKATSWPRVEIVLSHAGAGGALVDALVGQRVQGLVVAGTGNGSIHRELEGALRRAVAAGVKVVRATRCAQGRILARSDDVFADSAGLSPVKARIALMLDLLDAGA
ncbi:MAG: asparaginase [Ramlibacter sp.]